MRTFEYRLYPNKAQYHLLIQCLIQTRHIYNAMLAAVKQQYEQDGTFPSRYDLNGAFKGRGGGAVPASCVQMLSEVNPHYTSQKCFRCGEIVQKSLSVRTHICPHCGYVEDRDVNAAKNILKSARPGHGLQALTYTDGCSVA